MSLIAHLGKYWTLGHRITDNALCRVCADRPNACKRDVRLVVDYRL